MKNQLLFNYIADLTGYSCLESEMDEIIEIVNSMEGNEICDCFNPMTQTDALTGKPVCYYCGKRRS